MIERERLDPEFDIKCNRCDSKQVRIDSDVGWSPVSGGWGAVYVVCEDCGNKVKVWSPLS